MNQAERRRFLIEKLLQERPSCRKQEIPQEAERQEVLLRALMNVRAPKEGRTAMRIALASTLVKNGDTMFNIQTMTAQLEALSGQADLVLFGESVLQGFDSLCWDYETDRCVAMTVSDATICQLRACAKQNKIAVSFGFLERDGEVIYSSQLFIGADGEIVNVFRRVSIGWKAFRRTDTHYREGRRFERFCYHGKCFATALCGDLWADGRPEEMYAIGADIVLWPVWCDYPPDDWNSRVKYEYARQAARCGTSVLFVNPFSADADTAPDAATGGSAYFQGGQIRMESPAGNPGILVVELGD